MSEQEFIKVSKSFYIDVEYQPAFEKLGLNSIDDIFSFNAGKNLIKDNLAGYRNRMQFEIDSLAATMFLKRYDRPPILAQLRKWFSAHRPVSMASFDFGNAKELKTAGINTAKVICYGEQWGGLFEKRSFCITEKISDAESLERKLPDCFYEQGAEIKAKLRRAFIDNLAVFVKKFHQMNFRHRDLYFSHIFYGGNGEFYLIDLARVFKPIIFAERFRVKDIAQLYYSAGKKYFSKTDRLRFYRKLTGRSKLSAKDKRFIAKVKNKARKMAKHDIKHGRVAGFSDKRT